VDFARELQRGLSSAAKEWGVNIVGGDTNACDYVIVSVAMMGEVPHGKALTRAGAKPGDVLFVTWTLGGSYDSKKHLNFTPRLRESQFLVKNFKVNAMMDVSDGIASDIHRLAAESGVGAYISEEAVPQSPGTDLHHALTDGEDFELLFTLPVKEAVRLSLWPSKEKMAPFQPIGKIVTKKEGIWLKGERRQTLIPESGFRHF
jgi:thiamine-monophosphate kinase